MKISLSTVAAATTLASMISTSSAFVSPSIVGRTTATAGVAAAASSSQRQMFNFFGTAQTGEYPIYCEEDVMSPKKHGTSDAPVQTKLRWNCDYQTADRICNFNRHYAEHAGYWQTTDFLKSIDPKSEEPINFYDSVTGKLLFVAPKGRTMAEFLKESQGHGWPSFRDQEVIWENGVRCLKNGECISETGTHLGHNIPDGSGNRYCINLCSVAGSPVDEE